MVPQAPLSKLLNFQIIISWYRFSIIARKPFRLLYRSVLKQVLNQAQKVRFPLKLNPYVHLAKSKLLNFIKF